MVLLEDYNVCCVCTEQIIAKKNTSPNNHYFCRRCSATHFTAILLREVWIAFLEQQERNRRRRRNRALKQHLPIDTVRIPVWL